MNDKVSAMFVNFILIICVCDCFGFLDGKRFNPGNQLRQLQNHEHGNQPRQWQELVTFVYQKIEGMERLLADKDERVDQLESKMASQEQAILQKDAIIDRLAKRVSDLETIVMVNPIQEAPEPQSHPKSNMDLPALNITTKLGVSQTSSFEADGIRTTDDSQQLSGENHLLYQTDKKEEADTMSISKMWRSRQNRVAAPPVKQTVAFHTALSVRKSFKTGAIIIYDHEMLDHGDGYSPSDGLYIAPESGTYVFTWTTLGSSHEEFQTVLIVNGAVRGSSFSDTSGVGDYHQSTAVVVLTLNPGDHVFIRMGVTQLAQGDIVSEDIRYGLSTFSGWKLD
ncbi:uncharacterized protein LOC110452593 [Mizuhopecten yessoensis]|uniref:C1q domain-containing protein n=1 Tax=Mizuhopecten yessoensis TaxID=6573 RepID=A0A210QJ42_MIZYE|nr:uncharacterized protein LOC110452593 [Mizuhopecten yessoensis]OWF48795.1 hypothetical protein KP79_PYT14616 [Mizuhopecten yessoensis]